MLTQTFDERLQSYARECIAVRVRIINRVITKIYDDALRPLGVKTSQMNILILTASRGTVRPQEVCETLHMDASTVSRNVERLRAKGWLEILPDDDGRAQPFRLTKKGRRLVEKSHPLWETAQKEAKKVLGDAGFDLMKEVSERLGFPGGAC